jgi:hypothetical protein
MTGGGTTGPRRTSSRSAVLVAGLLVLAVLLASCAQVPRHGPVVEARIGRAPVPVEGEYNNPKGPQPGESQGDVVTGFFVAMTATPLNPRTAQKFLSKQAQIQWQPKRVVTYNDHTPALTHGSHHVVVRLRGADQVGSRGQWRGSLPAGQRLLDFRMVREDNQWRIAHVPNALIVPRTFFDQQYDQNAEIYFFDPTGRILVPEPVHVPAGSQLASSLVSALVRGPGRGLAGVARSFLPLGLSLVVSVPVPADGVADVTLKGPDPGPLSSRATRLIVAELSWTLRQDASITTGFRLNIAGHQIVDATGGQLFRFGTETNDPLDPAVSKASGQFYALRKGLLVSGQLSNPTPVGGPFGKEDLGIGAFAVSLDGEQVAGVTRTRLLVGSVARPSQATQVLAGPGLLRPAWDFAGRLWEVQNRVTGARVSYIQKGRVHRVHVPGVTGEEVRRFLVSRDGSRLVAVVRGTSADRIMVSRLRYDSDDVAHHGTPARRIPWVSSGTTRVRDIGWTSPTTLEVLDQISPTQAEARILNVDGSVTADESTPTSIPERTLGLATSPVGTQTPYVVLRNAIYDLAQEDATRTFSPPTVNTPRLRYITYAG